MTSCAVVLAVYDPDPDYLRHQLQSLEDQTLDDVEIIAVIADTRSAELVSDLADAQVTLALPEKTLNPVQAFEFGIEYALENTAAATVALC
ncbi:MAG: glycosyltransferase family 2 protein, partial [Planktomarina sp.]